MGKFSKIPANTFDALQLDAGVLLKRFDPEHPDFDTADIICATTGGINPTCVPTYSDWGEDVDNVKNQLMEFNHLDGWTCAISTTGLGTSPELIKMALGAADIDGTTKIVPRSTVELNDYRDLWWVGDKANGGFVAIKLKNALSTGGFSLQTTKNGKGQVALTITGFVSIETQDEVPMDFYSVDGTDEVFNVKQTLAHVTSSFEGRTVGSGDAFAATLTAATDYTLDNVIVLMGGEDITATAYDAGEVSIAEVTGDILIVATASAD